MWTKIIVVMPFLKRSIHIPRVFPKYDILILILFFSLNAINSNFIKYKKLIIIVKKYFYFVVVIFKTK